MRYNNNNNYNTKTTTINPIITKPAKKFNYNTVYFSFLILIFTIPNKEIQTSWRKTVPTI